MTRFSQIQGKNNEVERGLKADGERSKEELGPGISRMRWGVREENRVKGSWRSPAGGRTGLACTGVGVRCACCGEMLRKVCMGQGTGAVVRDQV